LWLATLDLGELANQRPGATVQVVVHSLALCLQAKTALALFVGGDPVVGNKPAAMHALGRGATKSAAVSGQASTLGSSFFGGGNIAGGA